MAQVHANVFITGADALRVRPRQAGGFHVLVGAAGMAEVMISFDSSATAETLAALLTLSAITHGDLGKAVAASAPEQPADNVVRLNRATSRPDQPTPPAASAPSNITVNLTSTAKLSLTSDYQPEPPTAA